MGVVEFFAERAQLALLQLANLDPAPALGGADDSRAQKLRHRPLAESMGTDLRSAALFEEESLEEVGGADHAAMAEWEAQMRDARLEVVLETLYHCRELALLGGAEVVEQESGQGRRGGLVATARPRSDLRQLTLGGLGA
jgi:hypothetical protein